MFSVFSGTPTSSYILIEIESPGVGAVCRVQVDKTAGHCFLPTVVSSGSPNVFVNGSPIVRVGDPIVPHTCPPPPSTHGGALAVGATNVFANS